MNVATASASFLPPVCRSGWPIPAAVRRARKRRSKSATSSGIREEYGSAALKQAQDSDDYAAFEAWTSQPSVTAAIDAAGLALSYAIAATGLHASLMAVALAPFQMAEAA